MSHIPPFVSRQVAEHGKPVLGVTKASLVATIKDRWLAVGYAIEVWITAEGEIRSDLINGLPRGITLELLAGRMTNGVS